MRTRLTLVAPLTVQLFVQRLALLFVLPPLLSACAFMIPPASTPDLARNYAEKAVIYGLPLVLMEQTRQISTAAIAQRTGQMPPANTFLHVRQLSGARSRTVVRPNNDTLYSVAWLDLSQGPVRLDVPAVRDRYWIMPFMDAWTNVFATVGSRTHAAQVAAQGATWWVAGSAQRERLPAGAQVIESPTDMVWLIGRIELRGSTDLPAVRALQDGFKLSPPVQARGIPAEATKKLPPEVVREMSAKDFFAQLASLIAAQKPPAGEQAPLALLAALGLKPGEPFPAPGSDNAAATSPEWFAALDEGKRRAFERLAHAGLSRRDPSLLKDSNGWSLNNNPRIGVFGDDYGLRSAIALSGLGALAPADAWYPATDFDSTGARLSGTYRYHLHFPNDALPPAKAFWSVTLYDEQGYFIENPISRYALTDRDPLRYNADGSLTLLVGVHAPADTAMHNNWLPAPPGHFNLTMRLYDTPPAAFGGAWMPPKVERLP